MKGRAFQIQREAGFRINLADGIILVVLALLSAVLYVVTGENRLFPLPIYVGLTFFLFCNVFRIGNRLEYVWSGSFIITVVYGLYHPEQFWSVVLWVCEPLKGVLILFRMIKGPYRGVLHRWINRSPGGGAPNPGGP